MTEIANLSNNRSHPGVSPAVRGPDRGAPLPAGGQEFSIALGQGRELNEIQSSETRQAVQQSLDGLQQNSARERPGTPPADDGTDGATEASPPRPLSGSVVERPGQVAPPTPARPTTGATPESTDLSMPVQTAPTNIVPATGAGVPHAVPTPVNGGSAPSEPENPVHDGPRNPRPPSADHATSRLTPLQTPANGGSAPSDPEIAVHDESRDSRPASADRSPAQPRPASGALPATEPENPDPDQRRGPGVSSADGTTTRSIPGQTPANAGSDAARSNHLRRQAPYSGPSTDDAGARALGPRDPRHAAAGVRSEGHNETIDLTGLARPANTAAADPVQTPDAGAQRAAASQSARFVGHLSEVADRILVSLPDSAKGDEVRIQLRSSILDGSGVRIFRDGGELNVVFIAQTESAQRFLADNQARFQVMLGDRLPDDRIRVEVEPATRRESTSGDNEGRSRQRYHPQPDEPPAE